MIFINCNRCIFIPSGINSFDEVAIKFTDEHLEFNSKGKIGNKEVDDFTDR
jgi:hypothetical protein